jgi:hypothetical protein
MEPASPSPEQTLFAQWRKAADESHFFELGLARKALIPEGDAASDDEWQEALRLRGISNQLYRRFMNDMDSKVRTLRAERRWPRG